MLDRWIRSRLHRTVGEVTDALESYDAYASGIRRDESPARADTAVVEWDDKRGKVKINPLAAWTQGTLNPSVVAADYHVG